jgi:hypothetical protein
MHADAQTAKPCTTVYIPNHTDRIMQVITKHEQRLCVTLLNTVGSVSKAHELMTRGLLTM